MTVRKVLGRSSERETHGFSLRHLTHPVTILNLDVLAGLRKLESQSVQCCVTSPPYWGLRDYGTATWEGGDAECDHKGGVMQSAKSTLSRHGADGRSPYLDSFAIPFKNACRKCGATRIDSQLGLERTPEEYVSRMVEVFREVRRVLKNDGVMWLNLGDSYATGGGKVGNCPGGGEQGERWSGFRGANPTNSKRGENIGPITQPNRMPLPGLKPKDLIGIPWRVAFALQADGWYLRSDIIWHKPNPMPESVRDRPTKAHEYLFLFSRSAKYRYNADAIREPHTTGDRPDKWQGRQYEGKGPALDDGRRNGNIRAYNLTPEGRNKRSVWTISTRPFKGAHFAVFPEKLIEPCILAGSAEGDTCLDPFTGSGTVGVVALRHDRQFIGIELNPAYCKLARERIGKPKELAKAA